MYLFMEILCIVHYIQISNIFTKIFYVQSLSIVLIIFAFMSDYKGTLKRVKAMLKKEVDAKLSRSY